MIAKFNKDRYMNMKLTTTKGKKVIEIIADSPEQMIEKIGKVFPQEEVSPLEIIEPKVNTKKGKSNGSN